LQGIRAKDGFSVVLRVIHSADRFNLLVKTQDEELTWEDAGGLDLWTATVTLAAGGNTIVVPSSYGMVFLRQSS